MIFKIGLNLFGLYSLPYQSGFKFYSDYPHETARVIFEAQYTSDAFIGVLKDNYIQISMDGKGCYRDNIFVERLWRTVKYEHLYTREFFNLKEVRKSLTIWFCWYNKERFHQSLDNLTPDEVYYQNQANPQAA